MPRSFPTLYKLSSSAQVLEKVSVKNDTESFINKLDQRDPLMEPCGTPACIFFGELKLLFIYTDCFRFIKP